ncbi:hypothetical protein [Embleya scabrispora]|uniref:hypothetical protein n=1 Tax=Embleya scabrispora TaxID=159449 RepID=UPI0003A39E07|nr:hypothetical protein [Embleya scabrispora]
MRRITGASVTVVAALLVAGAAFASPAFSLAADVDHSAGASGREDGGWGGGGGGGGGGWGYGGGNSHGGGGGGGWGPWGGGGGGGKGGGGGWGGIR